MRRIVAALVVAAVAVAVGCSRGSGPEPGGEAAPPSGQVSVSTTSTAVATTATTGSPPAPGCPPVVPASAPAPDRPRYTASITIDAEGRTAAGASTVRFTPDIATERVLLRLWPANPKVRAAGGGMELTAPVAVDGRAVEHRMADPTLVELPVAVAAGQVVEVATSWRIRLPVDLAERWSVASGAVRLGSFVPLVPWEPGRGWAIDAPTGVHGESTTSPVADWDLTIDAAGLDVVASGAQVGPGRWRAEVVRDVAVVAGRFRRVSGTTSTGTPVTVVADQGVGDDPQSYLTKALKVLDSFAARFGPYPWPSYTVALTTGLTGGIEYPMLVMQGPGSIGRSTSHEIGHMWFYGLVGNNQARDPWLDEGLATWAEAGYEGTLPAMVGQEIPADGRSQAAQPVSYWDAHRSSYYRGVYIQTTQALAALGPAALVDCALRAYSAAMAHRIAVPEDLKRVLRTTFPDADGTLARFGL